VWTDCLRKGRRPYLSSKTQTRGRPMIVVTGASRKLGGYVIRSLLEKVPAGQIIAAARNTEKASSLAELGV
jgi:nucleoside-diphosphate-sugar epimerase